MMNVWNIIESLLREDRRFRGDTFVSFSDLRKLGAEAKFNPDPKGGVARVQYSFDPSIFQLGDSQGHWYPEEGPAMAMATTQSSKEVGAGRGSGGTTVKTNWGGRVHTQHAPVQPHHNDRLGSSMDRYDVVMTAEFGVRTNKKGIAVPEVVLTRIAWTPSIGSQKERESRLSGLMAGRLQSPDRRPQGDRPVPSKRDQERPVPAPQNVPRVGQNVRPTPDDDTPERRPSGGQASSDFKKRLAAISRGFYSDDEED